MSIEASPRARAATLVEEGAAFASAVEQPIRKRVIVVGGGQAGLSVGYHLKRLGEEDFLILDASRRIGDAWRNRWNSLQLFTPAAYDGLDGLPFPAPKGSTPSKDAMADYLDSYARHFRLPILLNTRVDRMVKDRGRFVLTASGRTFIADRVIVAMSNYQIPRVPSFAGQLSPSIRQFTGASYRSPSQMAPGTVLVVGGGNSGAEIARDLASTHRVVLAGRKVPEVPGSYSSVVNRRILAPILNRIVFPHIMSVNTPIGRRARSRVMKSAVPLIRVKARDLDTLGIGRVGRITGVRNGLPALADGSTLEVDNVVWCTGYDTGLDWIEMPALLPDGEPDHERGVAANVEGLYFVGQHFLTSMSSGMVNGVGRDAMRIVALALRT
jgi:putative flavoprotein involved in K+ transport